MHEVRNRSGQTANGLEVNDVGFIARLWSRPWIQQMAQVKWKVLARASRPKSVRVTGVAQATHAATKCEFLRSLKE